MEKKKKMRWIPLESNYVTFNSYVKKLGVKTTYKFGDIYGLDQTALSWVPQPCKAVLLLYPITTENELDKKKEEENLKNEKVPENLYFLKQTIGNACGTMGLLHLLFNSLDVLKLGNKGLKEFYEKTKNMTPTERSKELENLKLIHEEHEKCATDKNNTKVKQEDMKTWKHFTVFINVNNEVYEFDGRRSFPVSRGKIESSHLFIYEVGKRINQLIQMNPKRPYEFATLYFAK